MSSPITDEPFPGFIVAIICAWLGAVVAACIWAIARRWR